MSRLSEVESFIKANQEAISKAAELNDRDIISRLALGMVADSNLEILRLLAEIADAVCPGEKEISDDN